ncbi:MAG: DNA mismatch repair endonuclease MutL [Lachnospiraceae bacterium]|nr:DNA mismatch repair endonuclease MutL [Lachnospiraceae bacterium]
MREIVLLSSETIDKIAAGEVVERPLNVVKELVENSIDASAKSISVEIKGGGSDLIRVTDDGFGIEKNECEKAFIRHATSKLRSIEDLESLASLGFRGEALAAISAVSKTEMITKTYDELLGTRVLVEGGKMVDKSDVGAPIGTTFIVRNLFYNTPARRKFLKSANAEGAMVEDIIEKFALSNPDISFQLIVNGKTKLSTGGNGALKDVIYHVFGKDVYKALLEVNYESLGIKIKGFCAKPEFSYQARNGELYFVNKRFVKSKVINTAIEEVYRNYLMQHRFPFCVLYIDVAPDTIDVNVHPQKMEVKFSDNEFMSDAVIEALYDALNNKDLIPKVSADDRDVVIKEEPEEDTIEEDLDDYEAAGINEAENDFNYDDASNNDDDTTVVLPKEFGKPSNDVRIPEPFEATRKESFVFEKAPEYVQETFFEKKLISDEPIKEYRIIGQVFDTYWLITLDDDLYIVDQHAAHEKVNYERFMNIYNQKEGAYGQSVNPPMLLHLSAIEANTLLENMGEFNKLGFEIDEFGQGTFALRTVPLNLYGIEEEEMFKRLLSELIEKGGSFKPTFVCEKLASLSCKAAIKGGQRITSDEMANLMKQLMKLENPYNCPHGRPVFIRMTKTELEKKFKRIV